jgi:hypothetical protein
VLRVQLVSESLEARVCEAVRLQKAAEQVLVRLPPGEIAAKNIASEVAELQARIAGYVYNVCNTADSCIAKSFVV